MVLSELKKQYFCKSSAKFKLGISWPSEFVVVHSANVNEVMLEDENINLGGRVFKAKVLNVGTILVSCTMQPVVEETKWTTQRSFNCQICDYSSDKKFNLKRHLVGIHKKVTLDTVNKDSKCGKCGKKYCGARRLSGKKSRDNNRHCYG